MSENDEKNEIDYVEMIFQILSKENECIGEISKDTLREIKAFMDEKEKFAPTVYIYEFVVNDLRPVWGNLPFENLYPNGGLIDRLNYEIQLVDENIGWKLFELSRFTLVDKASKRGCMIELTLFPDDKEEKRFSNCTLESIKLGFKVSEIYNCKCNFKGTKLLDNSWGASQNFYIKDNWKKEVNFSQIKKFRK